MEEEYLFREKKCKSQKTLQIDNSIKEIEIKQDMQYNEFRKDFENFKLEIFKQLAFISEGKEISPPKVLLVLFKSRKLISKYFNANTS